MATKTLHHLWVTLYQHTPKNYTFILQEVSHNHIVSYCPHFTDLETKTNAVK